MAKGLLTNTESPVRDGEFSLVFAARPIPEERVYEEILPKYLPNRLFCELVNGCLQESGEPSECEWPSLGVAHR